ncbi:hypothetical protein RJ639_004333 [Escallonia herrerae]|uniref:Uncharacterized protein n=1 Tax=Escallonia herrerae TaxID=1293975 RepID=A0AA89AXT6_9ASTE|nr:hypothetical protein RJ639_004333 [Escallonia herrerae]
MAALWPWLKAMERKIMSQETECPNSLRNGIGYLSGFVAGTGKGLVEGIKASEPRDTLKLHMNQVLNASGYAGWRLGNLAGHRAAVRRDGEWDAPIALPQLQAPDLYFSSRAGGFSLQVLSLTFYYDVPERLQTREVQFSIPAVMTFQAFKHCKVYDLFKPIKVFLHL